MSHTEFAVVLLAVVVGAGSLAAWAVLLLRAVRREFQAALNGIATQLR